MLLGTLGVSLLSGRGRYRACSGNNKCNCGKGMYRVGGEGLFRAGQGTEKNSLILPKPHPLTNFEIIFYFNDEPKFNRVYFRNNLPETIKNGAYIINLDENAEIGTHWIALFVKNNKVTYFDSFSVEYISKEVKKFICQNKNIKSNIFRIQAYDSIMCGYFCILFIDFMLKAKTLNDFNNLFSPNFKLF